MSRLLTGIFWPPLRLGRLEAFLAPRPLPLQLPLPLALARLDACLLATHCGDSDRVHADSDFGLDNTDALDDALPGDDGDDELFTRILKLSFRSEHSRST